MKSGCWFLGLALLAAQPAIGQRLVEPSAADSARPTAMRVLRHLAEGELEAAAALSNAPRERLALLRGYRNAVGEEEFRRVYGRYFVAQDRLVAELARGPRRLLIWDLGEAGNHIAGQFYIEVDGKFVMDDKPSRERSELRALLEKYRRGKSGSDPDFRFPTP